MERNTKVIKAIIEETDIADLLKEYFRSENTGAKVLVSREDISSETEFMEDGEMSSFLYLYNGKKDGPEFGDGLYRINMIAGKFYPDVLLKYDLPEKSSMEEHVREVYSRVYSLIAPHRIHVLELRGKATDKVKDDIIGFAAKLICADGLNSAADRILKERDKIVKDLAGKLSLQMHGSESMKKQLEDLVRFSMIAGIPIDSIVDGMNRDGLLPAKDKKEGKIILGELQRRVGGSAV